jgi:hypothetical protein
MNELMQVVLAFSECPCFIAQDTPGPYNQRELANLWLDWVAELSGDSVRKYNLVLLCPSNAELPDSVKAWGTMTRFAENNSIASWPIGPNRVFQQVMWFYYHKKMRGAFLWIEADCMPVTPDWLDLLADDYRRGGKPFMGAIVEPDPPKNKAPRHMTGNAVYPENAYLAAPRIMEAYNTAWDVHAAGQILRQCHQTKLIQHDWRCPEIVDAADLRRRLLPKTALFHSDKFGAIPRILRASARYDRATPPQPGRVEDDEPKGIPILQYAASRGVAVVPPDAPSPSLDDALRIVKEAAEEDPQARKRIAKFMVVNDIVNHGHCTHYGPFTGKKGAKPKPARGKAMTDAEFQLRIAASKQENAPANAKE